jgi:hypothetical protein
MTKNLLLATLPENFAAKVTSPSPFPSLGLTPEQSLLYPEPMVGIPEHAPSQPRDNKWNCPLNKSK